ncbi:bifunctional hydroxymethylpyrimidine kinase/phosphomethylpyrimidine kinase [Paenibacillus sp. FSL W8-1187]|uniref:Hydroxymethylpyrimidine/phosphomethylpyrimidine kinase n=1 Tax=Paenibacillus pasadenensis TaxID=217090 RepID=A0A2N5N484_9BACL|nr:MULTISPECIES: bifunctional hydroxymethylpyrimidine kinase/phosphomethylpyrimidine kinase [Paenibacillus]PLT45141.1 Hydroxymethylpyrimidine phosphate kinase ThiD [Paenibacillus pasadenensis]QGG55537.1 bifunctional hydroxymethylpyrimidine kinase/phosphomethylpyrimidine kinase [Paenibacillus sp. B01]
MRRFKKTLTIAGSDSGGGAGIQADLKTFQELGTFGMSVLTAATAQNSVGVQGVYPLPAEAVARQLDSVLDDIGADAVKTGMLFSADIIGIVAGKLERCGAGPIVVDPVMISKHGSRLLEEKAAEALRTRLLPLAEVITPNLPEACALLGWDESELATEAAMEAAARELLRFGSRHVLLKGGHLPGSAEAVDLLLSADRPDRPERFAAARVPTPHTHGTGCTTASAIAALLALGHELPEAARRAKAFTLKAIQAAGPTGAGTGSLWHAAWRSEPLAEAGAAGSAGRSLPRA